MKKFGIFALALMTATMLACASEEEVVESSSATTSAEEGDFLQEATDDEVVKYDTAEETENINSEYVLSEWEIMMGIDPPTAEWNEEGIGDVPITEEYIASEVADAEANGWRVICGYDETDWEKDQELIALFGSLDACDVVVPLEKYIMYYEPDCTDVYFWNRVAIIEGSDSAYPKMYGYLDCGDKGRHKVVCTYTGNRNYYYDGWIFECEYFDKGDPLRKNE